MRHLKQKTDLLIDAGEVSIGTIIAGTDESMLYISLTSRPEQGVRIIGRGEAAAIVLAKQNDGILASNNLRDIMPYVRRFGLRHTTTADILLETFQKELITVAQGDTIWADMLKKQRKLPDSSFAAYLKRT